MKANKTEVLLVSGGTGGHMQPCAALQGYLHKKHIRTFVVTSHRSFFPQRRSMTLPPLPQKRTNINFLQSFYKSTVECLQILKSRCPTHLILFGSIYCAPMLLAFVMYRLQRKPCKLILQEQNAILGRFHRVAQFFADIIALSYAQTAKLSIFTRKKSVYTGTPVRPAFKPIFLKTRESYHLLIVGGSQGANFFASSRFLNFFYNLKNTKNLKVYHQVPSPFISSVRHFYKKINVESEVSPYFANVDELLPQMSAVITRAGGSTLAELMSSAMPSLLIPYPYATDQHQKANAEALLTAGAALMLDEQASTPQSLASSVKKILYDQRFRADMIKNIKPFSSRHSCEKIYKLL